MDLAVKSAREAFGFNYYYRSLGTENKGMKPKFTFSVQGGLNSALAKDISLKLLPAVGIERMSTQIEVIPRHRPWGDFWLENHLCAIRHS